MEKARRSYMIKSIVMLLFVLADIALNTVVDRTEDKIQCAVLAGIQVVLRLCALFALFIFISSTLPFHYGLLGRVCRYFRTLFVLTPLSIMLLALLRGLRTYYLFTLSGSTLSIWLDHTHMTALFVLHNLLSIAYYIATLQAVFELGNPAFYRARVWVTK